MRGNSSKKLPVAEVKVPVIRPGYCELHIDNFRLVLVQAKAQLLKEQITNTVSQQQRAAPLGSLESFNLFAEICLPTRDSALPESSIFRCQFLTDEEEAT